MFLGLSAAVAAQAQADLEAAVFGEAQWTWPGPDGATLRFASEDRHLEFLSAARIAETRATEHGINRPLRVVLELDGTTARGVFRTVDRVWRNERGPDGEWHRLYKDSYVYECAAYELSRVLGLDRVPPTTLRRYAGHRGSLQAWVENARMVADLQRGGVVPPDIEN